MRVYLCLLKFSITLLWAFGYFTFYSIISCLSLPILSEHLLSLSLSENDGEFRALLCFSLLSYQRVPILLFEISSFVPDRLLSRDLVQFMHTNGERKRRRGFNFFCALWVSWVWWVFDNSFGGFYLKQRCIKEIRVWVL